MGNRIPVEAAIKEKMGADTKVVHTCGMPFTVSTEIDGKKSKSECMPLYYCVPCCCASAMCKGGIEGTAANAAAIEGGGAPPSLEIER